MANKDNKKFVPPAPPSDEKDVPNQFKDLGIEMPQGKSAASQRMRVNPTLRGGPGPGGRGRGPKMKMTDDIKALIKRLLWGYVIKPYFFRILLVIFCIIASAIVSAASGIFLGRLIDGYILPLATSLNPDFSGMFKAILVMGGAFLLGIVTEWARQWLMTQLPPVLR